MHINRTGMAAVALVTLLLLVPVASAAELLNSPGLGTYAKQGASGQVYVWQSGSC